MIRSQSLSASNVVVPDRFASVVSRASVVTFPFATPSSRNFLTRPSPLFSRMSSTSRTTVLYPAAAHTCAMPEPINPQPSTPTDRIAMLRRSTNSKFQVPNSEFSIACLDDGGNPLPAADARRGEAALLAASAQFEHHREQQPRAARTERMAERDRAAVDVDLVAREAELFLDREILARERFVHFDEIDVVERQAGLRQRPARCRRRSHAHQRRIDAGRRPRDQPADRLQLMPVDRFARREDQRRAAVDDAAGIAGSDRAVLLECRW